MRSLHHLLISQSLMAVKGEATWLKTCRLSLFRNWGKNEAEKPVFFMHRRKAAFYPCYAWSSSAMATFQQPLLIEQRSRTKFSAGAYSYQPNNIVRPFQTDPEEHSRSSGRLGAKHSPSRRRGRVRALCPHSLEDDTL